MKLLFSADVRLGAVCVENLTADRARKWRAARTEKLSELMDQAAQNNAAYVALYGRLFGQERVSESVIDALFAAVRENNRIRVLVFLDADEYNRVVYRSDIPENLNLFCTQTPDMYTDEHIALRLKKGATELQLSEHDPIWIQRAADGSYILSGTAEEQTIPSFEPIGFEDIERLHYGYGILEWTEEKPGAYTAIKWQKYAFREIEIKILSGDEQKEILRKINAAVRDIDMDTFLRITLTGRSAFGLRLNGDALASQLQRRIFSVEVYDNTIMDIDEEAFENDISLRSEFVRLALQDDSLSESERNRLIACGWNALNGKEVSAE